MDKSFSHLSPPGDLQMPHHHHAEGENMRPDLSNITLEMKKSTRRRETPKSREETWRKVKKALNVSPSKRKLHSPTLGRHQVDMGSLEACNRTH